MKARSDRVTGATADQSERVLILRYFLSIDTVGWVI